MPASNVKAVDPTVDGLFPKFHIPNWLRFPGSSVPYIPTCTTTHVILS